MAQLLGLVALIAVAVGMWIQRGRAMARVVAEGEDEAPVAACTVDGAQGVYDEIRWLRLALDNEAGHSAPAGTRLSFGVSGGGMSVGVSRTAATASSGGGDRKAHASSLRVGISALPDDTRAALDARGIDALLAGLPDRVERVAGPQEIDQVLVDLRRVEAGLTC